jgi:UDP-N-acetylglucosamine 1-carboxyvinyltransferase
LTDGVNTYSNVPDLRDIDSTLLLLAKLGVRVDAGAGAVRIDAGGLNSHEAPYDLVRKMRASVLVLVPLVARLKKARVSLPGGCAIGARPINLHLKSAGRARGRHRPRSRVCHGQRRAAEGRGDLF